MPDGLTRNRAWAMRTSRDSEAHRRYILGELGSSRLRQGWGYQADQDLRIIKAVIDDPNQGWAALSQDQRWTSGHWRMLGELAARPEDAMLTGDVVLVPNVPQNGSFTLCRLDGRYDFALDPAVGDLGHLRPVEVLTPGGVANDHPLVSAGLRQSLRCRSRLWWIGHHLPCLQRIIEAFRLEGGDALRLGADPVERARRSVADAVETSLNGLAAAIAVPLRGTLQAAEWEPVIGGALLPLVRDVQVIHTGGPAEHGADLEIHVPNPFAPSSPWIIAVQVKDYGGVMGVHVAEQLEQAITSRQGADAPGQLVAVVLASVGASPSPDLVEAMERLSKAYGVSVSCVHGEDLMRVIARGLMAGHRAAI